MVGGDVATLDDYRALLADARAMVVILRNSDVGRAGPEVEWFDRWRDTTVDSWNRIQDDLAAPDPVQVAARLNQFGSLDRAMTEGCDWETLSPQAEEAYRLFVHHLLGVRSKISTYNRPGAQAEMAKFFPTLAAEFQPVAPRQPQPRPS